MGTRGTGGRGQRFSLRHFLPPRVTPELGVPGRVGRGRGRCGGEKPARLHLRAAPGSGSVLPRASWSWGRRRRDLHEGRCPRGPPARSSWARGHGRVSAWARVCASPAGRRREREVTERRGAHAGLSRSPGRDVPSGRRSGRRELGRESPASSLPSTPDV